MHSQSVECFHCIKDIAPVQQLEGAHDPDLFAISYAISLQCSSSVVIWTTRIGIMAAGILNAYKAANLVQTIGNLLTGNRTYKCFKYAKSNTRVAQRWARFYRDSAKTFLKLQNNLRPISPLPQHKAPLRTGAPGESANSVESK